MHVLVQLSSTAVTASANGTGPSESADDDLPSVMTCANYLKLPPYSTKVLLYVCTCQCMYVGYKFVIHLGLMVILAQEIMFKKLLYAISEGQGSFDLSWDFWELTKLTLCIFMSQESGSFLSSSLPYWIILMLKVSLSTICSK